MTTTTDEERARLERMRDEVDGRASNGPCEIPDDDGGFCRRSPCVRDEGVSRCRMHAQRFAQANREYDRQLNRMIKEVVEAERAGLLSPREERRTPRVADDAVDDPPLMRRLLDGAGGAS